LNANARPTKQSILQKAKLKNWFHIHSVITEDGDTGSYMKLSLAIQFFLLIMWIIHDMGFHYSLEHSNLSGFQTIYPC
jgi:hypothetical protein